MNTLHSSVLLCGTALIDQTHAQHRILIVLSEVGIGAWQENVIVQAKETFHLTAREATVVQHLLKGWTNKEIANEMRLAEQTIKEYFKHIAEKTSATTRTGIAMTIIHSGLRQALATTLTTCDGASNEWYALRAGGIGLVALGGPVPPL